MPPQKEALLQTFDLLETWKLSVGLKMPRCLPGRAKANGQEEGGLSTFAQAVDLMNSIMNGISVELAGRIGGF